MNEKDEAADERVARWIRLTEDALTQRDQALAEVERLRGELAHVRRERVLAGNTLAESTARDS